MVPASISSSPLAGVKKGQILSFDFLFACSVFLLIGAVLAVQAGHSIKETQESREKSLLLKDTEKLSEIFFSEGLPKNWTYDNVQILGLQEEGRISFGKLGNFSRIPYQETLIRLGMSKDYNISILSSGTEIFSFGASYGNSSSLVKRDRICVLENGTLVITRVFVFEK